MYSKFFTRFFLLIGMMGILSSPLRADEIQIGSGTQTDANLPSHSYYKYSLTQQIYTAAEIEDAGGGAGTINSIAFYNGGSTKTRNFSIYLVNTDKESFSNATDWITVTANDLVFSGEVEMTAGTWKTIAFSTPFSYDGGNLAVVVDDNTGSDVSGMACLIFIASETQSIYYRNDYTNPDPTNPTISGTPTTYKNQIILDIETAAVTCAKPKNFNAESITAHEATLTWTAGAEGQTDWDVYVTTTANDVPDENTTPTYQVTECSKALANLAAQTTYYAYVRANCGSSDKSKWANKTFSTTREALTVDATHPYSQDFETSNDWGFNNGTLTNNWCWSNTVNNGGQKSMYVSKDGGTTYEYAHSNTTIYASKLFAFTQGTYTFVFDWLANGEGNYDYIRVALIPGDMEFEAGTSLPSGVTASALPSNWISLDGGKLNLQNGWQTKTAEVTLNGTYTMVFLWRNDGSGGNQPPAAIDNISISFMTCPRPSNLTASDITGRTATLSWTENGTATNWVLQYATDNGFTENLVETNVSGTASKNLTGLTPETTYYARVKSILGNDESSWSDTKDFTTTVTCEAPVLSYVYYSNTAHTGTVNWTGNADNYELIYSTAYSFNPGDEGVTQIDLGNVNTYTLQDLAPETTYRIKVRANCGAEDGYSAWSNQVSFTTTATCVKPTGLTASDVTGYTASITWTAGQTEQDAWNFEYKKSSETEWQTVAVTTTSYNLSGLSPVTTYDIRVQADCGEGDLSQWTTNTFTTGCGAVDLPYTCDFEGTMQTVNSCKIPSCWSVIRGYYNNTYSYGIPTVANQSSSTQPIAYPHGGSYALYFLNSTNSGTSEEYAILPEISEDYQMNKIQIRFWVRSNSSSCTMEVGLMSDPSDAATFTKIEDVDITSTYTEITVPFGGYSGRARYIALKCPAASMYSQAFYVDDITVEEVPSCEIPTDLHVVEPISANQNTIEWTPGDHEVSWELEYIEIIEDAASEPQTAIIDGTPSYTLYTNGDAAYSVKVRAQCFGNDNYSDWTPTLNFTTPCEITTVNANNTFSEDFNSEIFPPNCWLINNEKYHGQTGTGWFRSVNNNLDNQGAAVSYWYGNTYLIMPPMNITSDVCLTFDQCFANNSDPIASSIVVSTTGTAYSDFSETLWFASNAPTNVTKVTVPIPERFMNRNIYIAFKFGDDDEEEKEVSTQYREWFIDNVEIDAATVQTVALVAGWNWWSTNLDVTLEQLEAALGTNGVKITAHNGNYASYRPEHQDWRGNIVGFGVGNMYKIQTSAACTLTLSGEPVNPADVSITLIPGANWIGFPLDHEITDLNQAISSNFTPTEGDIIKDSGGHYASYHGTNWRNNGLTLRPGQGYIYMSKAQDETSFTFNNN